MLVDGFLVLYDMSINDAKLAERQAQLVGGLLAALAGAKRRTPFALVTTKNDLLYQMPRYTTSTPGATSNAGSAAASGSAPTLVPTAAFQRLEAIFSAKELRQYASSILRCAPPPALRLFTGCCEVEATLLAHLRPICILITSCTCVGCVHCTSIVMVGDRRFLSSRWR